MSQSGVGVRTMSHKCGKYESEWSECERKEESMSQSGVGVRTMSHKCGRYKSEWSKCERKEKSPCEL